MTKYHSDDYIKFLRSIRPDNMSEYSKQMQRCESILFPPSSEAPSWISLSIGEAHPAFLCPSHSADIWFPFPPKGATVLLFNPIWFSLFSDYKK